MAESKLTYVGLAYVHFNLAEKCQLFQCVQFLDQ